MSYAYFEYPQQPQSSEHREAEGASLDLGPHDLEDGAGYDHAVEPVERGLEIYPRTQRVHLHPHLHHEQPEEYEFGVVCEKG